MNGTLLKSFTFQQIYTITLHASLLNKFYFTFNLIYMQRNFKKKQSLRLKRHANEI